VRGSYRQVCVQVALRAVMETRGGSGVQAGQGYTAQGQVVVNAAKKVVVKA